jgi:hypothetical protein
MASQLCRSYLNLADLSIANRKQNWIDVSRARSTDIALRVALEEVIDIARQMRYKSFSKELKGTVKEVLGTAFSVGCQVDGKSPRAINDAIDSGEIDSKCQLHAAIYTYWLLTFDCSSRGVIHSPFLSARS